MKSTTETSETARAAGLVPATARWTAVLAELFRGSDLSDADTAWIMEEVVRGDASPVKLAGFLAAIRAKGETAAEIRGLAQTLRDHAVKIHVPGTIVDVVGTGGAGGLNISTMAALVVAAAGLPVVKHGNRGASTACGSADMLERLGLPLDLTPQQVERVAVEAGITFCFAPVFHPSLRHAASVRRELGVPTVFNVLAPLVNPADPRNQLVGVSNARMAPVMADVLAERGCSALVVHGSDGLDELTTATTSDVWVVRDGAVRRTQLDPTALGIPPADPAELLGADTDHNVKVVREFLAGRPGAVRDAVLLNAAAALLTVEPAGEKLVDGLATAMTRCREVVDSGAPADLLERWLGIARQVAAGEPSSR